MRGAELRLGLCVACFPHKYILREETPIGTLRGQSMPPKQWLLGSLSQPLAHLGRQPGFLDGSRQLRIRPQHPRQTQGERLLALCWGQPSGPWCVHHLRSTPAVIIGAETLLLGPKIPRGPRGIGHPQVGPPLSPTG